MLKQYQRVTLNRDSLIDDFFGESYELRRGQRGQIMEVYKKPGLPIGYDVEFFDENGDSVGLMVLLEEDLLPFDGPDQEVA